MARTDANSLPDSKDVEVGALGERSAHPGSAALQEKAGIDAGLTGDKVAHTDVSASPLGTDDEAGGGGPKPVQFPEPAAAKKDSQARDANFANERSPRGAWLWVVVALVAALVLGFVLLVVIR